MTFGQRLRAARKEKGFTQKALAATIEVKHNSVSNWEHDQNKPDLDTVRSICAALGVNLTYLLGDETESLTVGESVSPGEAQLLSALRRLSESEQMEILEFAMFKLSRAGGK